MTRSRPAGWMRLLLLAMALSLVAAACGSSDTTDTTAGGDTTTTAASTDTTAGGDTTTTAAPSGGDEKTTLQTVMSEEATDMNPFTTGQQGKGHVYQAIFNPLLMTDNENNIISNILESWEASADAQTLTLTLKPDVVWSDGTPMTAEDLRFSLQAYL